MTWRNRGYSANVKRVAILACGLLAMVGGGGGCNRGDENASPASRGSLDHSQGSSPLPFLSLTFDEAVLQARAERKLILVDVYTDWCGWCTKMDQDVFTDARVQAALLEFVPIKVNADKGGGRSVASRYRVRGLPTFLLVNGDGELVGRFEGYLPAEAFLLKLGPSGARG